MRPLLHVYEQQRLFDEPEAWLLYRLAAFGEAIGWSLLIGGLALKRYALHGNNDPVLIGGQLHGMLFLIYFALTLAVYPSLNWSRRRTCISLAVGVPPYGSLLFEQWVSRQRQRQQATIYYRNACYRYCARQKIL